MTDDDVHADRYLIADEVMSAAGFDWYEVSNWATSNSGRCLHNELYWRGADWWGAGPGAHSHVGGVRWWNVKHPGSYAAALASGRSPGAGREILTEEDRRVERVLLELRLREGAPDPPPRGRPQVLPPRPHGRPPAATALRRGPRRTHPAGRLLADAVVRDLVD